MCLECLKHLAHKIFQRSSGFHGQYRVLSITKAKSKAIKWGKDKDLNVDIVTSEMSILFLKCITKIDEVCQKCWVSTTVGIFTSLTNGCQKCFQVGFLWSYLYGFSSQPNGELKYENFMHTHTHTHTHTHLYLLCEVSQDVCFFTQRHSHSITEKHLPNEFLFFSNLGFPGSTVAHRGPRFNPWVGKIPWSRKWQLQYSCLENSMD